MDALVAAAMARWPGVPDVYGWLSLDARGRFLIRGETIGHAPLRAFFGRNYGVDERGCWHVQNGPQRVFVALACCPWVFRLDDTARTLVAHTDANAGRILEAGFDETGALVLSTELGLGTLLDRDLSAWLDGVRIGPAGAPVDESTLDTLRAGGTLRARRFGARDDSQAFTLHHWRVSELEERFGFVRDPRPR